MHLYHKQPTESPNLPKTHDTPNDDATACVQRSENLSAHCGVAAKYAYIY